MSATMVAVIGTLSTALVAIAGYVFNAINAKNDREAARKLAQDAHTHDASVKRADRAYADRKEAYLSCMGFALTQIEIVVATEPFQTFDGFPTPPELPTQDDWRWVQIRVNTFGVPTVAAALTEFMRAVRTFHLSVDLLRRAQQREAEDEINNRKTVEDERRAANEAYDELRKQINADLLTM